MPKKSKMDRVSEYFAELDRVIGARRRDALGIRNFLEGSDIRYAREAMMLGADRSVDRNGASGDACAAVVAGSGMRIVARLRACALCHGFPPIAGGFLAPSGHRLMRD